MVQLDPINGPGWLAQEQFKTSISEYERALVESGLPRIDCPTEHHFWGGFYIRQIHMPAGLQLTTKTHAKKHSFQVTKGVVEVVDTHGHVQTIVAPYVGITEAGTKRAIRVLEDCTWTTFHQTDAQTPEEAEGDLIIPNELPGLQYANARNQHPTSMTDPSLHLERRDL